MPEVERFVLDERFKSVFDIDVASLKWLYELLGIKTKFLFESDLPPTSEMKGMWLLHIVKALDGDAYYCGSEAPGVILDVETFQRNGVEVKIQRWSTPEYRQGKGAFIPDCSVLDALFWTGIKGTTEILCC